MNNELTVLIVEDDPHVLLGCQQALALEDIRSEGVSSAEQALAMVGDNFPGIVISDIRLPGIDGLELLKRLKARDRSLPVVLITGHGDISMAVGAMRDGAWSISPAGHWSNAAWPVKCGHCAGNWPSVTPLKAGSSAARLPCSNYAN